MPDGDTKTWRKGRECSITIGDEAAVAGYLVAKTNGVLVVRLNQARQVGGSVTPACRQRETDQANAEHVIELLLAGRFSLTPLEAATDLGIPVMAAKRAFVLLARDERVSRDADGRASRYRLKPKLYERGYG